MRKKKEWRELLFSFPQTHGQHPPPTSLSPTLIFLNWTTIHHLSTSFLLSCLIKLNYKNACTKPWKSQVQQHKNQKISSSLTPLSSRHQPTNTGAPPAWCAAQPPPAQHRSTAQMRCTTAAPPRRTPPCFLSPWFAVLFLHRCRSHADRRLTRVCCRRRRLPVLSLAGVRRSSCPVLFVPAPSEQRGIHVWRFLEASYDDT